MTMAANNDKNEITNAMPKSVVHISTPRGRAPATETRLLTTGSRWRRPDREEWQWLKLKRTPQISLAGRSILPRSGKRFRETGQVLSHHQLSSDTATEDDFFEKVLL